MSYHNSIKRWIAKRKAAVVMDIFKPKTIAVKVARYHELTVYEAEG